MKKLFFKTFIYSAVGWGISMFIVSSVLFRGLPLDIYEYFNTHNASILKHITTVIFYDFKLWAIAGFMFGLFLSSLCIGTHYLATRNSKYSKLNDNKVHQIRELELPCRYTDSFELCLNSLNLFNNIQILSKKVDSGYIQAKTQAGWKSFGEYIEFNIDKINESSTKIKIQSKPIVSTTLVDYGKNLENVESLLEYIYQNKYIEHY